VVKAGERCVSSLQNIALKISTMFLRLSGAFPKHIPLARLGVKVLTHEQKARLLSEMEKVVNLLAGLNLAAVTNHLVNTLQHLIDVHPEKVLLLLAGVIGASEKGGYSYEPLAVSSMVKITERYFSDYINLLQGNRDCERALLDILDVFVRAGWTQAVELVYRFGEIYR
jgi:hypothetical protein